MSTDSATHTYIVGNGRRAVVEIWVRAQWRRCRHRTATCTITSGAILMVGRRWIGTEAEFNFVDVERPKLEHLEFGVEGGGVCDLE